VPMRVVRTEASPQSESGTFKSTMRKLMKFKNISALAIAGLMMVGTCMAGPLSEADRKWSKVVEEMIVTGTSTIATPLKHRAEIARKLATKHGKRSRVIKKWDSFQIIIS